MRPVLFFISEQWIETTNVNSRTQVNVSRVFLLKCEHLVSPHSFTVHCPKGYT